MSCHYPCRKPSTLGIVKILLYLIEKVQNNGIKIKITTIPSQSSNVAVFVLLNDYKIYKR